MRMAARTGVEKGVPASRRHPRTPLDGQSRVSSSSSSLLSSLELSDTQVCESSIRALLGTASHFCDVVVFVVVMSSWLF